MNNELIPKAKNELANTTLDVVDVNTDANYYARLGWIIVLVGVLGFLLWASLAPLDKGVPLSGTVTVSGNRKAVQHQMGGTVDEILVKDGDVVKAGQPLVKMNAVTSKSNAEIARVQLYTSLATQARLMAERDNAKTITFPKELEEAKSDARVANNVQLQQQLFMSRQIALQSELSALDENISGLRSQLSGLQESMTSKKQQLQFVKEQLEGMRELSKDGFVPRNRLLDVERSYSQINGNISEDIGSIGRVSRQIAEMVLRRSQRQQDYQKEVRSQLAEVQKEAESLQNRVTALDFELNNVLVKAPVDGIVVGLNVFTNGAVIPSGFKLMEIVPEGDDLIVEGTLAVNLIDKVHPNLPVELIFSAFNSNTTPHIPGTLTHIAADRSTDEKTGMPYYKVRAVVTAEGKKKLGQLQIKAGMPVEMFVKTGERTMMNYLLKPIIDRAHSALTED